MFITISELNDIRKQLKELTISKNILRERVATLEFIANNPAKFKKGDRIGELMVMGMHYKIDYEPDRRTLKRWYDCYNSAENIVQELKEDELLRKKKIQQFVENDDAKSVDNEKD